MHFPIESGLISTALTSNESGYAELTIPVSGQGHCTTQAISQTLAQASALQDAGLARAHASQPGALLQTPERQKRYAVLNACLMAHHAASTDQLMCRLAGLGLDSGKMYADQAQRTLDEPAATSADLHDCAAPVYGQDDLMRLANALDVLEKDEAVQPWAVLRMAVVLGDKHSFEALLTLAELQIFNLNSIAHDGSTLLHTMAWHGVEDPLLMDMPFMLGHMPARDQFADMPEEYLPLDERIGALSRAGADMDSSIAVLRAQWRSRLARQGMGEEAIDAELRRCASDDAQQLAMLRQGPRPSAQSALEITWRAFRQHASPLMCALFDMQRDASKIVAVEALLKHGANPDHRFRDSALSDWLAAHGLPAVPVIPVHAAARNLPVEVMLAFLAAGVDLAVHGEQGETVLHWAALNDENPEVMKVLLASDAAGLLNTTDKNQQTPLMLARRVPDNHKVVSYLLEAGKN